MDSSEISSSGDVDGNSISAAPDKVDPATPWLRMNNRPPVPVAKAPVEGDAVYYNMNHKYRGIAVIFNHETFKVNNFGPRKGTNNDAENLKRELEVLGFQVWLYKDRSVKDLLEVIEKLADVDHADHDCLLVTVLSHGHEGLLYAKDAPYKPESLWTPFTADKCPSLAGKPKLFFIQACRGDKLDGGIMMRTETDSSGTVSYKIPWHADFLIAYSTVPGFYSWRNTSKGSWFIQALCDELKRSGFTLDIQTLLTFVNQNVALNYESNTPDISHMHQQRQMPCFTSMLTRLVKFTRKT